MAFDLLVGGLVNWSVGHCISTFETSMNSRLIRDYMKLPGMCVCDDTLLLLSGVSCTQV